MNPSRYTAIISSISNSFCDSLLDYTVNRYNYHRVLFLTSLTAGLLQAIIGLISGIAFPLNSAIYVVVHAALILAGYIFFVKSLKYIPLALIGLIEASSLFLTFMIDSIMGYVKMTPSFIGLLVLFIFSIFLFTESSQKKGTETVKKIRAIGLVYIIISVLLYLAGPYLVKLAAHKGANEIGINLGYYLLAIPYFAYQSQRVKFSNPQPPSKKVVWWKNIYVLCFGVGCFEAIYYIFETISFNNDAPTIVIVISQMRAFLLFILSVILKTDYFTFKKLTAVLLGSIAVIGIYLS